MRRVPWVCQMFQNFVWNVLCGHWCKCPTESCVCCDVLHRWRLFVLWSQDCLPDWRLSRGLNKTTLYNDIYTFGSDTGLVLKVQRQSEPMMTRYILTHISVTRPPWVNFWENKEAFDLTYLPLDKTALLSQTIFSDAFLWMKSFVFGLKFHWSLFLRVQLTIWHLWFR